MGVTVAGASEAATGNAAAARTATAPNPRVSRTTVIPEVDYGGRERKFRPRRNPAGAESGFMSRGAPKAERVLERGRASYGRQAWAEAYALLDGADREAPLGAEDLELLATAAHLLGRDSDAAAAGARAHREFLRKGAAVRAARWAY